MEKHIADIYGRASKELEKKAEAYFKQFERLDAQKLALVDEGKLTEKDYKEWRQNKIATGKHWTEMKEQAAEELRRADQTAAAYINGKLPEIYAINYNAVGDGISDRVKGYSFELADAATVKTVAAEDKTLLPYKVVDGKKTERWHTQRVNAEVLQGIIQGESIPNLSKRLYNVGMTARGSAVRNARTTVTSAENKGRMDVLHDAEEKGVIVHKVWQAARDDRTREAHLKLDGQEREIDEPFDSDLGEIMYPADPDARPENVYNCRCTLTYKVIGFGNKRIDEGNKWQEPEQDEAQAVSLHTSNMESYNVLKGNLESGNVSHRDVELLKAPISGDEIISKISGGDKTTGSCASLGFAYVGNTCGLDVTDYRGGNSQRTFSSLDSIRKMCESANADLKEYKFTRELKEATELLKNLSVSDKEYYFTVGRHAAIIRKDAEHGLQYLELQSASENGWKNFTNETLQRRFACRKTPDTVNVGGKKVTFEKTAFLADVSTFQPTDEFRDILGYINTATDQQKKGAKGGVK